MDQTWHQITMTFFHTSGSAILRLILILHYYMFKFFNFRTCLIKQFLTRKRKCQIFSIQIEKIKYWGKRKMLKSIELFGPQNKICGLGIWKYTKIELFWNRLIIFFNSKKLYWFKKLWRFFLTCNFCYWIVIKNVTKNFP